MKKFVLVVILLLIGAYIGWPYYSVSRLGDALRLADKQGLEKYIDFDAVRESTKADIESLLVDKARAKGKPPTDAELKELRKMMSEMLDAKITAEGLAKTLLAGRKVGAGFEEEFELSTPTWTGANAVTAEGKKANEKTKKRLKLTLKLAGLEGWRVVRIEGIMRDEL